LVESRVLAVPKDMVVPKGSLDLRVPRVLMGLRVLAEFRVLADLRDSRVPRV
jgi:hypothetical protein